LFGRTWKTDGRNHVREYRIIIRTFAVPSLQKQKRKVFTLSLVSNSVLGIYLPRRCLVDFRLGFCACPVFSVFLILLNFFMQALLTHSYKPLLSFFKIDGLRHAGQVNSIGSGLLVLLFFMPLIMPSHSLGDKLVFSAGTKCTLVFNVSVLQLPK
jgi:hypothetical protein